MPDLSLRSDGQRMPRKQPSRIRKGISQSPQMIVKGLSMGVLPSEVLRGPCN